MAPRETTALMNGGPGGSAGDAPDARETRYESRRPIGRNGWLSASEKSAPLADPEWFMVITRGFFDPDGTPYWTKFVTVPLDVDLLVWLASEILGSAIRASGGALAADDAVARVASGLGVQVAFEEEPEEHHEEVVVG